MRRYGTKMGVNPTNRNTDVLATQFNRIKMVSLRSLQVMDLDVDRLSSQPCLAYSETHPLL